MILGVSGLVIATVFAVVASLASKPANRVQPLSDLPGPAIGSSTETVPAQAPSSATTAISASPKPTTTTPRTSPAPPRPATSTGQAAAQPPAAPGQNRQPIARFSADCDGLVCRFDGRASSDADGQVIYFAWGFGERGEGAQGQGRSEVRHQYGAPDFYTVTLVVMDNDGRIGQTTQRVTVTA